MPYISLKERELVCLVGFFLHQRGTGSNVNFFLHPSSPVVGKVDFSGQRDELLPEVFSSLALSNVVLNRPKLLVDRL